MAWVDEFLVDREPIGWQTTAGMPTAIKPRQVFLQAADYGLEVAVAEAAKRPTTADMRSVWKARQGGRVAPVLLVVGYPDLVGTSVAVCGPAGEDPAVHFDLEPASVERLAEAALAEPTRHAAQRCLLRLLPETESELPGVINSGLLANQELRQGVPQRPDWSTATKASQPVLKKRGRSLVEALGFTVSQLGANTVLLLAGEDRRAVAVFLDEGEAFDAPGRRFENVSPVSHALAVAGREHLSWVVLTRASEIRLYAARPDTGVGRRGPSQTFIEVNLALLPDELAGYLHLLFSADALSDGGTFEQILESSSIFGANLAYRLRERVYTEAVPALARAIAATLGADPGEADLAAAYDQTLNILFRLLFVAYGEDKDLLPYHSNSRYADHSLKRIARRLGDDINSDKLVLEDTATDLWEDVAELWSAVNAGNKGWGVPAYNGGLFSTDHQTNPAGAALAKLRLTNAEFGPALTALLVDTGDSEEVVAPVDFRSLSVREFGTIYEGLLESELSVAPTDLTVDTKGTYVPASARQKVEAPVGTVYLHNRSGSRKATGSYFTKPFAVEHLLDHALEPALDDHVARLRAHLDADDAAAAAAAFFDFRCADIAMGSGHFLVAAVDRIEARLSGFLALNPIPAVIVELERLRSAAYAALGELADGVEIETTSLLRRQVGRRCIYGVDRNETAVELARLAIWIHTFVPGLPLSFLNHNLVVGDSLTGIGTIDEALVALGSDDPKTGTQSLMRGEIIGFLGRASTALSRLAIIADATVADVKAAQAAHLEALEKVGPATALFDLIVANRVGKTEVPLSADEQRVLEASQRVGAHDVAVELGALHFPVAFPEVFLRENPGFDCILGNPPWEKLHVEEHGFWGLRFPGLRSMPIAQANREVGRLRQEREDLVAEYDAEVLRADAMRQVLLRGPYPDLGASHPDLYKAFCWRFWNLVRPGGAIGVVLPRSALASSGSASWRRAVLDEGTFAEVTFLVNNRTWVFNDVHPQWTVGLTSIRRMVDDRAVRIRGPFSSLAAYRTGVASEALVVSAEELASWSTDASFPLLPSVRAGEIFVKLRKAPRFDSTEGSWRAKAVQGDLNSTTGKQYMTMEPVDPTGLWPVYAGSSFNLWSPDNGPDSYYAWIEPDMATSVLQEKRLSSARRAGSVFAGFDPAWMKDPSTLPCEHPRVAFRRIARATDSRTAIAALVPPHVVLTDVAPYLLLPVGDERDEAFVLGVMCSVPFDWSARRVVEAHMDFHVLEPLPIPRPGRDDPLRRRVEEIAGRLAAVNDSYEAWADKVAVPVGAVTESEKPELLAELDAAVALLYGLDEQDLHIIYETFHEGADYSAHRDRVLAHYRSLA
jgi:hypothetical protein